VPEQPGSGQPRPDGPRETAKTPDELQREAEQTQREADEFDRMAASDAGERDIDAREAKYDEEHALGDALMGLGGGAPKDKPDFDMDRRDEFVRRIQFADAAKELRAKAAAKFREAAWARQAIAGALLAVGGLMTIGGVAGAGNTNNATGTTAQPTTTLRTPTQSGAAAGPNLPPVVGPIVAVFNAPQTSYSVQASDPEGRPLTYTWQKTQAVPCGTFTSTNNVAVWNHPDPPCPNEAVHPAIIFVNISDGTNELQRVYTQGSAPGTGNVPPSPSGSATPFPTTTTRPSTPTATTTATPTSSPGPDTGGGPNAPLTGGGLLVAGAGAALLATQEKKKKNCDQEKAEEERTRAAMDRAKAKYDDLNQTKTARDFARSEAAKADRAYQQSQRGAAIGEDTVTHQPTFGSGAKSQAAKAAYDKAQAAHDEANIRQQNYDAKGGDATWQQAKSDYETAKAAHDAAAAALAKCLEETAPPPPPPPTDGGGGGTTTDGGGGTTPPGGPVTTGGGSSTQSRPPCVKGTRRNEVTTSREFKFNELNRAEICIDSNYPYAVDPTYVEEFMDWLGTVRDTFKAGKTIRSFMEGQIVEGGLDLVDFPDFYTYFDKMTDELRKSMDRLVGIMRKKAKTGDWYLRYSRQVYTVTCTTYEECDGIGWIKGRAMAVERTGTERNKQTNKIQVDDPSEVQATIDTLFRGLTRENDQQERAMKEFQQACGS